ncbi:GspH/FimT family pseudopilin [Silvimonas soli]|uniref:GspH/FimT family pseudopilin n=1 Tax=Silvimonas soli TaxID=2980100 RepID=UPI0024B332FC|nr:GspH/FimT family pseudopilin [Silvimonas soli]
MLNKGGEHGFTLIEFMIAIAISCILLWLAIPAFGTWIQNTRTRTAAESLQNALRTAKANATQLNRVVTLSLTTANPSAGNIPSGAALSASGTNWFTQTVTLMAGENTAYLQGGSLGTASVTVNGPVTVCFNAMGRLSSAAGCSIPATGNGVLAYTVDSSAISGNPADRPLQVTVSSAGAVRMCDPAKVYSSSNPDGCFANSSY